MKPNLYRVNAFATDLTSGNPAYVVKLSKPKSDFWMQQVAKELNLPITAFLINTQDKRFALKWFTPSQEISLCGHGTMAAAHVLWEENDIAKDTPIYFDTKAGNLKINYRNEGIQMAFPSDSPEPADDVPSLLKQALPVPTKNVEQNKDRYIVELDNEEILKSLKPDFDLISNLSVTGVVVTSLSDEYDFISRYFAPSIGIDEDFVTGSAHCGLTPYWSKRLGKNKLHAFQASGRGGELYLEQKKDLIYITGKAYTVYKGTLL
ncbi:MAG TPA: PhzF family phenazine biosynthesis protein [Bacillus sp. (in: firmicutes)]|uniref:PhzF family phenazine biosynthesis protein n=1 Tax=Bacillus litorisediminis TaxID=2922713 RepID=UPI001FADBD8A|nr:PhzF family phenazine biosynthesis protein [Bacillus litorisediminis]HWO75276.1 PhzF family phenazine biosynthesis protein [Bacillus sp. (in: firmicutes)]